MTEVPVSPFRERCLSSVSHTNTYATLFYNPQCADNGLCMQKVYHALDRRLYCGMRLIGQPQHDNA